jgi:hypothetical protein
MSTASCVSNFSDRQFPGAIDGDSSEFPHGCSRNDIFQTEEDRQGNGVSVDIAQSVGGPSDEVLADRPNWASFSRPILPRVIPAMISGISLLNI